LPQDLETSIQVPPEAHQTVNVETGPEKANDEVVQPQVVQQESGPNETDDKLSPSWVCFLCLLGPIWLALVLAFLGLYIGCRIAYTITHFLGAVCLAGSSSTTKYKTDGGVMSQKAKDDAKCFDLMCSCMQCYLGVLLYISAYVTFGIAKLAIKILRDIVPIKCLRDAIKAQDKSFQMMDPRIDPTHTVVRIREV
jgi:hypothetical protein